MLSCFETRFHAEPFARGLGRVASTSMLALVVAGCGGGGNGGPTPAETHQNALALQAVQIALLVTLTKNPADPIALPLFNANVAPLQSYGVAEFCGSKPSVLDPAYPNYVVCSVEFDDLTTKR